MFYEEIFIVKKNVILISLSIVMHLALFYVFNSQFTIVKVVGYDNVSPVLLKARLVRVMPKHRVKVVAFKPLVLEQSPEQSVEITIDALTEKTRIKTDAQVMKSTPKTALLEQLPADVDEKIQVQASDILAASRRYLNANRQPNKFVYEPHKKATTSLMTGQPKKHIYYVNNKTDEEKRKIKVSCNNGTKKALVIISGLFGGTIQCQKMADLSQFIKPKYPQD